MMMIWTDLSRPLSSKRVSGRKRDRERRYRRANYTEKKNKIEEEVVTVLIFVVTGNLSLFKSQ